MRIVSTGYINTSEFSNPLAWLERINFHTGTLEELGKQHEVISIEQINFNGEVVNNGVTYRFLNFGKPKLYFPYGLHRYIQCLQPDIVLVHGLHFPFQVLQLRQMLGKKVKIIVQNHAEKPQKGWRRQLQRLADSTVNAYLFTSMETGEEWVKKGIIANKKKIAEAMEASSVFVSNEKKKSRNRFLWVGRLDRNKDPLTVVSAFLRFAETEPGAKLDMIYHEDGLLQELIKMIERSKSKESIRLVGKIPHSELAHWLAEADFIVSGSHYEGSGIAVCEGLSCGCIPILTDIPSFRKMTKGGRCGLLYEAGDAEALFAAFKKAVTLDREKEKEKILQQFNDELSFKAIANKINDVILSLDN